MTELELSKIPNPDLRASWHGMQKAAQAARKIAIETNTDLVISQNGKIIRLSAQELRAEAAEK